MISDTVLKPASMLVLFCFSCGIAAQDWSSAPERDLTLFYPGAATWEALLIGETHAGAMAVRQRAGCAGCHEGQQAAMGRKVAGDSSNPLYKPHGGMTSWQTTLQVAGDEERIYFRIDTGDMEQGRLAMMIDDGAFESSALSGCWSSCHQDSRGMPAAGDMDLSKYLPRSRTKNTRTGGGTSFKTPEELQQLANEGQFVELLGARFSGGSVSPLHGYVLESRHMSEDTALNAERKGDYLIISRPLAGTGGPRKDFVPGGVYSLGLAFHPEDAAGADHLVSFPVLFTIDGDGRVSFVAE